MGFEEVRGELRGEGKVAEYALLFLQRIWKWIRGNSLLRLGILLGTRLVIGDRDQWWRNRRYTSTANRVKNPITNIVASARNEVCVRYSTSEVSGNKVS